MEPWPAMLLRAASWLSCKEGELTTPRRCRSGLHGRRPCRVTSLRLGAQRDVNESRINLDIAMSDVTEPVSAIAVKLTYPKDARSHGS